MPAGACFSYSSGVPLGNRTGTPAGKGYPCFSYSSGVQVGARNRDAAQRALPELPRMPAGVCFSYSSGMPLGNRPGLPEGRLCFSY